MKNVISHFGGKICFMVIDEKEEGKERISCLPDYQYLTANYFSQSGLSSCYTQTRIVRTSKNC